MLSRIDPGRSIYRNRENLRLCKQHGIRLSGPSLGRPKKDEQQDWNQARLQETSETVIALQLLVMNLERKLRFSFCRFSDGCGI
jgi:hypothetical protein